MLVGVLNPSQPNAFFDVMADLLAGKIWPGIHEFVAILTVAALRQAQRVPSGTAYGLSIAASSPLHSNESTASPSQDVRGAGLAASK